MKDKDAGLVGTRQIIELREGSTVSFPGFTTKYLFQSVKLVIGCLS